MSKNSQPILPINASIGSSQHPQRSRSYIPHFIVAVLLLLETVILLNRGHDNFLISSPKAAIIPAPTKPCHLESDEPRLAHVSTLGPDTSAIRKYAQMTNTRYSRIWKQPMHISDNPTPQSCSDRATRLTNVLTHELNKPVEDRVDWLMWSSADSAFLSPEVSMQAFLPPEHDEFFHNVNLLLLKDDRGVSSDILFLRISEWSLQFANSMIDSSTSHLDEVICHRVQQETIEQLIHQPKWRKHITFIPKDWISGDGDHILPDSLHANDAHPTNQDLELRKCLEMVEDPEKALESADKSYPTHPSSESARFWQRFKSNQAIIHRFRNHMLPESLVTPNYRGAVDKLEEVMWRTSERQDLVEAATNEIWKELSWMKRS